MPTMMRSAPGADESDFATDARAYVGGGVRRDEEDAAFDGNGAAVEDGGGRGSGESRPMPRPRPFSEEERADGADIRCDMGVSIV